MEKGIIELSPLTEASLYVLLSLTKPLHGYGVIKKVSELTNGRVNLVSGTLYGVIKKMLKIGLISVCVNKIDSKGLKQYELSNKGIELVKYEINRLKEILDNGENILGELN
jgi:DNA-binding PadR family transcriptional regulator